MNDFFADLERQLITAAHERPRRRRRARARRAATVLAVASVVLAAGVGLTSALTDTAGRGAPATTAPPTQQHATTVVPQGKALGGVQVGVLNATTEPGLARGVANRLHDHHVRIGNVTNATDQSRATTHVLFAPRHAPEARRVAAWLGVRPDRVRPLDAGSAAVAGEDAAVVVRVGADQDSPPIP